MKDVIFVAKQAMFIASSLAVAKAINDSATGMADAFTNVGTATTQTLMSSFCSVIDDANDLANEYKQDLSDCAAKF